MYKTNYYFSGQKPIPSDVNTISAAPYATNQSIRWGLYRRVSETAQQATPRRGAARDIKILFPKAPASEMPNINNMQYFDGDEFAGFIDVQPSADLCASPKNRWPTIKYTYNLEIYNHLSLRTVQ